MAKSDDRLDFSKARAFGRIRSRSLSAVAVPGYSLYGEAAPFREWFVNLEPLALRAEERDWVIEPHTHPKFTQLVFVTDGNGELMIDGDAHLFESPAVLVVPPFHIHSLAYDGPTHGSVLTIENNYLAELITRAPEFRSLLEVGRVLRVSATAIATIIKQLRQLGSELGADARGRMVGAEVQLLSVLLTLLRDVPEATPAAAGYPADLVDRFMALAEERYRDQPDLSALASELGVTTAQLRSACKRHRGLSPLAILHDRVLAEAKRCLTYTTLSVGEVAYSLGYTDVAYFSRFFSEKLGVSPTEFRKSRAA